MWVWFRGPKTALKIWQERWSHSKRRKLGKNILHDFVFNEILYKIPNGRNPKLDKIPNGQNPKLDKIHNEQNPKLHQIPNGRNPKLNKISNGQNPELNQLQKLRKSGFNSVLTAGL